MKLEVEPYVFEALLQFLFFLITSFFSFANFLHTSRKITNIACGSCEALPHICEL